MMVSNFATLGNKGVDVSIPSGSPSVQLNSVKYVTTEQWSGRPSVIEKNNGEVVMLYVTGIEHPENNDQFINIKFTDDYGDTWSNPNKYLDGTSITGFPLRVNDADLDKGPVLGYGMKFPNSDRLFCGLWNINSGTGGENDGSWMVHSDDGGITWTTPQRLSYTNWGGVEGSTLIGEDHTIVGNTIYSGFREVDPNYPRTWQSNQVFKSTDCYNWEFVGNVSTKTDPTDGTKEIGIERVGTNRLTTLLRPFGDDSLFQNISNDLGITWPSPTDISGTISNKAIGRTIINTRSHLKGTSNWWKDPVLIAAGYESTTSGSSVPRRNMIMVSKDNGDTWSNPLYLDTQTRPDGGYGDIFYNPNSDEYVALIYRGVNDFFDGRVEQYNFKITWS